MSQQQALYEQSLQISDKEFSLIRELVYSKFGINLTEQKRMLVVGRLQKILREKGFHSFLEYHDYVLNDTTGEALITLVNRISTNHTFFYRESDHFDFFSNTILPKVKARGEKGQKKFRLWCAGCSSGEEPYTLAMLVCDFFKHHLSNWDIGILATDISHRVLELARAGVYTEENMDRLPAHLKRNYFRSCGCGEYAVRDEIKKLILFRPFNLMREKFPFKGTFDVIFCRNVMIYFDDQTKHALVDRFSKFIAPSGYLLIGHSETLGRRRSNLRYVQPAVYRKDA